MGSWMFELLKVLRAVVLLVWPLATLAAGNSLGSELGAVTAADWVSLLLLASVSGLVALLHRVRRSFEAVARAQAGRPTDEADEQLLPWWLFALCHMAGAMFVGLLAFLLCEGFGINNYIEAAAIALASWQGAKLADKWADNFGDGIGDRIAAAFGRAPPPPDNPR